MYPYAPSFVYMGVGINGSGNGGAGGNDCNSGTGTNVQLCITGPMIQQLNIRYAEGGFYGSGAPTINGAQICNDGQYCHWVAYQTIENQTKENGFGPVCSSYLDNAASATNPYSGSGTDPGYYHTGTPTSSANRFVIGSGTCSSLKSGNVYMNPQYASGTYGLVNAINANWFNAGSNVDGPNGDVNVYSIWDNMGLNNNAPELGNGTELQKTAVFVGAYSTLFANFHYPQIFNAVGAEGGFGDVVHHPWGTSGAFNCDTTHFECNDPADFCANDVGSYFKGVQSERALLDSSYPAATFWMQAIYDLLDTYTEYTTATNCAGTVDIIPLNPINTSPDSATFEQLQRMQQLATRILLTPESYTGKENDAGPVMERYLDCYSSGAYTGDTNCPNQVGVYAEDGWQFIPYDTGQTRYTGGGNGSGCSQTGSNASASGGAATFTVRCVSDKDDAGYYGAILSRAGHCYLFGVDKGNCVLLASVAGASSNATTPLNEPILNTDCHVGGLTQDCNQYPKYVVIGGRGPENCYEDLGTNLGTASGTCNSGDQICPAANGCQGYASEATWGIGGVVSVKLTGVSVADALGDCPGPLDGGGSISAPNNLIQQCWALLVSQ